MKLILLLPIFLFHSVKCFSQTIHHVMDSDTALFELRSLDGRDEIFLKDYPYQDGKYVVHSFGEKKIIRMRFEIKNGKPCGEMIKYYWSGKIIRRTDYGKCN